METKYNGYVYVFEVQLPIGTIKMLYDETGSEKSIMTAFKPEIHIAKLVAKIGTKVQLLYICI